MQTYRLVLTKNARKDVQKLDRLIAKKLHKKLRFFLAASDPLAFAVRLSKPADAQYRWRVGDYRVLFDCDPPTRLIIVLKIQHRRQIYASKRR